MEVVNKGAIIILSLISHAFAILRQVVARRRLTIQTLNEIQWISISQTIAFLLSEISYDIMVHRFLIPFKVAFRQVSLQDMTCQED